MHASHVVSKGHSEAFLGTHVCWACHQEVVYRFVVVFAGWANGGFGASDAVEVLL